MISNTYFFLIGLGIPYVVYCFIKLVQEILESVGDQMQ